MTIPIEKQIETLKKFITERRWELFNKVLNFRTEYITVVLEDIYQPHNASAVLRSCDIFGIQKVHIIENRNRYQVNPEVAVGAYKWLDLIKFNSSENNTLEAIKYLKTEGYRIVATTPHKDDVLLEDFDLTKGKVALFFGSELPGLTETVLENADEFLKIPMYGFTESFNISVSVAIILYSLVNKLHKSDIQWQLSEDKKNQILLNWLKKNVKDAEKILQREFNV